MNSAVVRYKPAHQCIYCGSQQSPLSDEHIIPYALNGNLIIPNASCNTCANVTKKFEQKIARDVYGLFRIQRGYRTRRPKERPRTFPLHTVGLDGTRTIVDVEAQNYPSTYLAIQAPPPGILSGLERSDRNPELNVSLKGLPSEIDKILEERALHSVLIQHRFDWAAFFRQLAKIGHCFAYACTEGVGYEPLLPDIILGKSNFLSHFVGCPNNDCSTDEQHSELSLYFVPGPSECDYLVTRIVILGLGTLYPYEVVVGRISDMNALLTFLVERR